MTESSFDVLHSKAEKLWAVNVTGHFLHVSEAKQAWIRDSNIDVISLSSEFFQVLRSNVGRLSLTLEPYSKYNLPLIPYTLETQYPKIVETRIHKMHKHSLQVYDKLVFANCTIEYAEKHSIINHRNSQIVFQNVDIQNAEDFNIILSIKGSTIEFSNVTLNGSSVIQVKNHSLLFLSKDNTYEMKNIAYVEEAPRTGFSRNDDMDKLKEAKLQTENLLYNEGALYDHMFEKWAADVEKSIETNSNVTMGDSDIYNVTNVLQNVSPISEKNSHKEHSTGTVAVSVAAVVVVALVVGVAVVAGYCRFWRWVCVFSANSDFVNENSGRACMPNYIKLKFPHRHH